MLSDFLGDFLSLNYDFLISSAGFIQLPLNYNITRKRSSLRDITGATLGPRSSSSLDFRTGIEVLHKQYLLFATNSNLLIPISLHPDCVHLSYFKLRLLDVINRAYKFKKIKGLR